MNLSMSVIGFFHTLACLIALVMGAYVIATPKGTPRHRRLGDVYTGAILFASFSSLTIYTRHAFTMAHWFGVIAIILSAGGFALGRWHGRGRAWKYAHIVCMLGSYYVLIGGGVNEVFLRVNVLRSIFFHRPQVVSVTHVMVMLFFMALIRGFLRWDARANARLSEKAA